MNKKILCVDDDLNVLEGYQRTLRKEFDIHVAAGGALGLESIESKGPFAVIISDMRMPEMDGVQFLSQVKETAPDSIRIMLTGNADQQTAVQAVNQGKIFSFLTKPCLPETLLQALRAGVEQYRLLTAEKQLLGETLNNSLQVVVDILALVNPIAFSRSTRVKRLAYDIAKRLGIPDPWEIKIAATLSQIGCITVSEETLMKIAECAPLTGKELNSYNQHPQVGRNLICQIPRLETVATIIGNQNRRLSEDTESELLLDITDIATTGARILKLVLDFDSLLSAGNLPHLAIRELTNRVGWYDPIILNTLKEITHTEMGEYISVKMRIPDLKPGMILGESFTTTNGITLFTAGQEVTLSLILRLSSLLENDCLPCEIYVRVPSNGAKQDKAHA